MRSPRPFRSFVAGGAALLAVWPLLSPSPVVAFSKTWELAECLNVSDGEVGLWDDAPGAGLNNESGFFWLRTNEPANERCTYRSAVPPTLSDSLKLSVRAAVNDGAVLRVVVRTIPPREIIIPCGGDPIGSVVIYGSATNVRRRAPFVAADFSQSEFVTEWVSLAADMAVGEVCLMLDDVPSDAPSERASALIDYIKISQSLNPPAVCTTDPCKADIDPATVWQETFQRPY